MVKYVKMVLNEIIVIVFEILLMYIVRNVFILLQYIFLDGWLFYFDFMALVFIRYGYDTATKNVSIIITAIIIARNNSGVLVTSFIIGVFYVSAGLKDEFLKFCKMVGLNVSVIRLVLEYSIFMQHVFKLLLFLQVMFFIMIGFWDKYITQEQWNQLLLLAAATIMWYFDLSRKDEVNFNCITILKIYLHDLQIFECVRMIVNEMILLIYDILLRYTFFNDLFFYFMVLIFILNDIAPTERQETKINRIAGSRTTQATAPSTNGAPHKNCLSDLLCAISNQCDIRNENISIGIDNFQLLYRVDTVFLFAMVTVGRDAHNNNNNNNESKHLRAAFSNQLERKTIFEFEQCLWIK